MHDKTQIHKTVWVKKEAHHCCNTQSFALFCSWMQTKNISFLNSQNDLVNFTVVCPLPLLNVMYYVIVAPNKPKTKQHFLTRFTSQQSKHPNNKRNRSELKLQTISMEDNKTKQNKKRISQLDTLCKYFYHMYSKCMNYECKLTISCIAHQQASRPNNM